MSTLWTPSGEHPVDRNAGQGAPGPPNGPAGGPPPGVPTSADQTAGASGTSAAANAQPSPADAQPSPADAEEMARLQRELATTPVEVVVANHCFGLFELAAVYLSQQPEPLLDQARLAIDALGALVEGLEGRLGEPEPTLKDGLAQLRLAFVQLEGARRAAQEAAAANGDGPVPGG